MRDTEPQTAEGKVLWHFTMSLDGFVAGPGHAMDWMTGFTGRDGIIDEYTSTTGAVLGGRDGWDLFPDASAAATAGTCSPTPRRSTAARGAGRCSCSRITPRMRRRRRA